VDDCLCGYTGKIERTNLDIIYWPFIEFESQNLKFHIHIYIFTIVSKFWCFCQ
jgi:hypothetical protein